MFHGRVKVPPGRIIEVWQCPKRLRKECLELMIEKMRIEAKEKREEEEKNRKAGGFKIK